MLFSGLGSVTGTSRAKISRSMRVLRYLVRLVDLTSKVAAMVESFWFPAAMDLMMEK